MISPLKISLGLLPLLLIVSTQDSNQTADPLFTAVASQVIYPSTTYNISVFVEPSEKHGDKSLKVVGDINTTNGSVATGEISIMPGQTLILPIKVPELSQKDYNLTLTLTDSSNQQIAQRQSAIYASQRDKSVLIQTDKAIYKPGETVKFRVVLLNRDSKPLSEDQDVQIRILDGNSNLIKNWPDVTIQRGFYKNELQLSTEPVLGDWTIEVKMGDNKPAPTGSGAESVRRGFAPPRRRVNYGDPRTKQQRFSVEKYTLPKYEVKVKLPNYLTYKEYKVPVQIVARYTYGKPVVGEVTLTVSKKYSYDPKDVKISRTLPIANGTAMVDLDLESMFKGKSDNYDRDLQFEAEVTEGVTGKKLSGSSEVRIYNLPYKISLIKQTDSLKPGLPFTITLKVSTQDDIPISDDAPTALQISHGFSYDLDGSSFTSSIPKEGILTLKFRTPTNDLNQPRQIQVKYKELTQNFYIPSFYNSDTDRTYMQIQLLPANEDVSPEKVNDQIFPVESPLKVNVNATKLFQTVNYVIHGRQNILAAERVTLPQAMSEYNLEVKTPRGSDPEARLIVYIVLPDTQKILADSLMFKARRADGDVGNFLNVTLSNDTAEPGDNVTLSLESTSNSLVALRGVDQSVLLLKEDSDITQKTIDDDVILRENEAIWTKRAYGGSQSFQTFSNGGLLLLTNANITVPQGSNYNPDESVEYDDVQTNRVSTAQVGGAPAPASTPFSPMKGGAASFGFGGGAPTIRTRTNFPETWLWDEISLNESTSFDLSKTVPDTLTSWIITGYSLNPDSGVGFLSEPQKLTVFRPFFISLNLPYSVVRDEVLLLQVLIHNYLGDEPITAEITLSSEESGAFELAGSNNTSNGTTLTSTIELKPNTVSSLKFPITPKKLGLVPLHVQAKTSMAGDALDQPLRVIPPGERQKRSTAAFLNPEQGSSVANLNATFPEERVEGADSVKLTFISDVLGSTITNLDQLLFDMPLGCGEQNLMNFVVNTIVLNYVKASGNSKVDESVQMKARKFLENGYQRELTYRHPDGSFSSFGPQTEIAGSTWLTSFVARSFVQAQPFITVDDNVIGEALKFLVRQQTSDGGFYENGRNYQWARAGNSQYSGVALSAYVLLTFIEVSKHWKPEDSNIIQDGDVFKPIDYDQVISKGMDFIRMRLMNQEGPQDVFALALATYAASLADHSSKAQFLGMLKNVSKDDEGLVFWEIDRVNVTGNGTGNGSSVGGASPFIIPKLPWEYFARPISIQMTSYALLSYIQQGQGADALPIVRWLLNQQNSNGGFSSTQDTVVALAALAEFGKLTSTSSADLKVTYDYNGNTEIKQVTINADNAEVLQEFELPADTRMVEVTASGKGSVLAQLSWTYYVQQGDDLQNPAFSVSVNATQANPEELRLDVCTMYLEDGSSGMTIVEVNLPSGYVVETEGLDQTLKAVLNYKRHDLENGDTKLNLYLQGLAAQDGNLCFPLIAERVFKVGESSPSYVSVYDYYDTTKRGRAFYEAPRLSASDICEGDVECKTGPK